MARFDDVELDIFDKQHGCVNDPTSTGIINDGFGDKVPADPAELDEEARAAEKRLGSTAVGVGSDDGKTIFRALE